MEKEIPKVGQLCDLYWNTPDHAQRVPKHWGRFLGLIVAVNHQRQLTPESSQPIHSASYQASLKTKN